MVKKIALASILIIQIDATETISPFRKRVAEIADHFIEEIRAKSEVNCSNNMRLSTITQLLDLFRTTCITVTWLSRMFTKYAINLHISPVTTIVASAMTLILHYDNGITAVWVQFSVKSGGSNVRQSL